MGLCHQDMGRLPDEGNAMVTYTAPKVSLAKDLRGSMKKQCEDVNVGKPQTNSVELTYTVLPTTTTVY